jgi:diaminopimelate decarboxylase/aspartate kinase
MFHLFKIYGVSVDFISTSQSNVTVTLDNTSVQKDKISHLKNELQQLNCIVESKSPCAAISCKMNLMYLILLLVIGNNITHFLGKIGTALRTFNRQIYLTSQSASNVNFTFLVDQSLVDEVIEKLHSSLFANIDDNNVGPLLKTLISDTKPPNEVSGEHVWWRQKRDQILELVKQHGTPLYVYDQETIVSRVNSLLNMKNQGIVDKLFYALKANSNTEILKVIEKLGMGFECVSLSKSL